MTNNCKNCKNCSLKCVMHHNKNNPFPYLTPGLCDHSCKTDCVFKCDFRESELEEGKKLYKTVSTYPKKLVNVPVLIIGLGVSGLTVAHNLLKSGYRPYVSEDNTVGGLITTAIPKKRVPNLKLFKKHANKIARLCGNTCELFEHYTKDEIICIDCTGCKEERRMFADESVSGITFLKELNTKARQLKKLVKRHNIKKVAIVGLGNTACDVAEQVYTIFNITPDIYYRKTIADSHANKESLEVVQFCSNIIENTVPTEEDYTNYNLVIECIGQIKKELSDEANLYYCGESYLGASTVNTCIDSAIATAENLKLMLLKSRLI